MSAPRERILEIEVLGQARGWLLQEHAGGGAALSTADGARMGRSAVEDEAARPLPGRTDPVFPGTISSSSTI